MTISCLVLTMPDSSTGSSTESTGCSDVWLSDGIVNGTLVPGCCMDLFVFIDTEHDG